MNPDTGDIRELTKADPLRPREIPLDAKTAHELEKIKAEERVAAYMKMPHAIPRPAGHSVRCSARHPQDGHRCRKRVDPKRFDHLVGGDHSAFGKTWT